MADLSIGLLPPALGRYLQILQCGFLLPASGAARLHKIDLIVDAVSLLNVEQRRQNSKGNNLFSNLESPRLDASGIRIVGTTPTQKIRLPAKSDSQNLIPAFPSILGNLRHRQDGEDLTIWPPE